MSKINLLVQEFKKFSSENKNCDVQTYRDYIIKQLEKKNLHPHIYYVNFVKMYLFDTCYINDKKIHSIYPKNFNDKYFYHYIISFFDRELDSKSMKYLNSVLLIYEENMFFLSEKDMELLVNTLLTVVKKHDKNFDIYNDEICVDLMNKYVAEFCSKNCEYFYYNIIIQIKREIEIMKNIKNDFSNNIEKLNPLVYLEYITNLDK